ncbi:MAG: NAD-dependent epimerase/dehydratase family protein [Candidatus Caldarchaeum sp.]|nr:NAD-dependent epimerase/dehydratase family protein [Candidatus Caldarchaeum sp.]
MLATGGAGFIGSRVVAKLLEHGYEVDVVDDFSTGDMDNLPTHPRLRVFRHDITDAGGLEDMVAGVEAVLHMAAIPTVPECEKNVKRAFEVNVKGVENIAKACVNTGVKRVVFFSSAAVYSASGVVGEESPVKPLSVYGYTKLVAEEMLRCLNEQKGIDTTVLRIFNVYGRLKLGKGSLGVVDQFIADALSTGCLKIYGDGEQVRDFIHVDDVAEAVLKAVEMAGRGHRVYNIGSGEGVSIAELAQLVQQTVGTRKINVIHLPSRPKDIKHSVADVSKAARELGFRPRLNLKTYVQQRAGG